MEDGEAMFDHCQATTTQPSRATQGAIQGNALRGEDLHEIVAALRRYALALVRNPSDADDLVQESLTRAMTYNPEGVAVRRWRPYLFSILHNVFVDQRAKVMRMRELMPITDSVLQIPCASNQQARLELRELIDMLARLPDEQREVILLAGLEGLSYKEIAEILDLPIGTVMSRLSRGRQSLRRLMEREGEVTTEVAH